MIQFNKPRFDKKSVALESSVSLSTYPNIMATKIVTIKCIKIYPANTIKIKIKTTNKGIMGKSLGTLLTKDYTMEEVPHEYQKWIPQLLEQLQKKIIIPKPQLTKIR